MLSGNYDRPLPSQIHAVFRAYEHRILSLRPFNFQPGQVNAMNTSNASLMSLWNYRLLNAHKMKNYQNSILLLFFV